MNNNNSRRHRHGDLDKYYTNPTIADDITRVIQTFLREKHLETSFDRIVEPAAGNGAFLRPLLVFGKPLTAFDIAPEHPEIVEADFFDVKNSSRTLYVGNPPFGHAANLAIRFFNHAAANSAEIIAFILPRSFRKSSVQDRLDRQFHLVLDHEIPTDAFLVNGQKHDVSCVLQIWQRLPQQRPKRVIATSPWIEFTDPGNADHAIRRVGRRAGDLLTGLNHNRSTTLFFKISHPKVLDILRENAELRALGNNTSAVRSICKSEILYVVEQAMVPKSAPSLHSICRRTGAKIGSALNFHLGVTSCGYN
ncbi:hypothetical protein [Tateyamaria pelophila]|uniref:hypothetical protein n=1 Tax=Tateyamaria pelophila TaxID=328415 RepID=UPI001CC1845C|nr:hypothetical protein [Tateyamaria pelophila]